MVIWLAGCGHCASNVNLKRIETVYVANVVREPDAAVKNRFIDVNRLTSKVRVVLRVYVTVRFP